MVHNSVADFPVPAKLQHVDQQLELFQKKWKNQDSEEILKFSPLTLMHKVREWVLWLDLRQNPNNSVADFPVPAKLIHIEEKLQIYNPSSIREQYLP